MSAEAVTLERPDYSKDRKAEVLALVAAYGGNVLRAARETGIPHQTIHYWLSKPERYSQLRQEKVTDLAQQCESDANYYLGLAREKAPDAPYNHLITGAAIAIDKMLVLRNLSAQPNNLDNQDQAMQIRSIVASARGRLRLRQTTTELTVDQDGPANGPASQTVDTTALSGDSESRHKHV